MMNKPKSRRTATLAALLAAHTALAVALGSAAHAAPSTERVSVNSAELQADGGSVTPAVSNDGSFIAFTSGATNFHGGPHNNSNEVYVRDKVRGATELVSKASSGQLANGRSLAPAISGDGQIIAFQSRASNLAAGDTNAADDIYVHDRSTAITTLVSVSVNGAAGNDASSDPAVSDDGRYIAYASEASNLVSGDTNNTTDVFVYDRVNRTTTRASIGTTGGQGTGPSQNPSISRNGQQVAFESAAPNLIARADTNGFVDVFVGTRTGVQFRASQSNLGAEGNNTSRNPAISSDGSAVAFDSRASNLVNGDTNGRADVFHHTLGNRETIRVSNGNSSSVNNDPANGESSQPSINATGRVVAFHSTATNLVSGDTNGSVQDVFVTNLDRPRGAQNTLASVSAGGGSGNAASAQASLSGNSQVVAYHSTASNLVAGDTNGKIDVFGRALQ